jgi:3-hydroxybutyrate dehydrogenase
MAADQHTHLTGKRALITGSTSGIGLGIAQTLAAAGADVTLNGFGDADEIESLRAGIESDYGVKAFFQHADLSKADDAAKLVQNAAADMGGVDILVNNAGIQHVARVEDFPVEKWDAVIAINLSAAFHTTRAALAGMQAQNYGRIINIASVHGQVASEQKAAYVAAKHGIIGLTKVTALENAESNITANSICPGWVLTPLVQAQIDKRAAANGWDNATATRELLSEKEPTLRFTTPEHIGEMVVFLCGAAGSNITGAAMTMDGGWSAR